jgi:GNAT superfamily N-acetyltransferase
MSNIVYRNAKKEESGLVLNFIRELADYEELLHEVVATEADIRETVFGNNAKAFCIFSDVDDVTVGFALCFYNYSTFQGRPGIYIEDLYVREEYRGKGIGKGFFNHLAQRALNEKCGRIQWWCLNWNEPSIKFYKSLGAQAMDEFTVFRLEGDAINNLAIK